jgi:GT2 family glycosyltransferase
MTVSVIVPARDAAVTLPGALAALAVQRLDGDYEVLVVDSGSRDATPRLVEDAARRAGAVRLLRNPGGEPASSRNLGARHAAGDVLAFTDADCEPDPGWLAAGLRALRAGAELVQGRVVPARDPGPFDRTVSVGAEHGLYETANLFVTRAAFERAGGFAPVPGIELGAGAPFGEDAWFAWRARRAGAPSAFAPDAVVRHAVLARGPGGYVAERARCRHFPALVAAIPELRSAFLYRRAFLSPASARFDMALAGAGLALARGRRGPLLLALPWAAELARLRRPERIAARAAADAVTFAALSAGSLRSRTPVL